MLFVVQKRDKKMKVLENLNEDIAKVNNELSYWRAKIEDIKVILCTLTFTEEREIEIRQLLDFAYRKVNEFSLAKCLLLEKQAIKEIINSN